MSAKEVTIADMKWLLIIDSPLVFVKMTLLYLDGNLPLLA